MTEKTTTAVRKAFFLSFAMRYSTMLIQFVSMVIVSRLLLPEDIGLFAEAMAVVILVSLPVEQGLHDYLIQEEELTTTRRQTAMGLGLLCGILGSLILLGWNSLLFFWLNPASQTPMVLGVLTMTVLLRPLTMPAEAILHRQMRFDLLYIIFTARALLSALVVIILAAFAHLGAVALAWGMVVERVVTLVGLLIYQNVNNSNFRVWEHPSFSSWQKVFTFTKYWTGIHALRQGCDALLMLSIAQILGSAALGLFNRSQMLVNLYESAIMQAISPVLLPYLSAKNREKIGLTEIYLKKLSLLSVTAWPFFGFMLVMTEPIIQVIFGENWIAMIPLVRVLCIAGLALPFNGAILSFVVALGQTRAYFPLQLIIQITKFISGVMGSMLGLAGIGLAYISSNIFKSALPYRLLKKGVSASRNQIFQQLLPSLFVTICSLCIPLMIVLSNKSASLLPEFIADSAIALLIFASAGSAIGWVISILLIQHPIKNLRPGISNTSN